MFNAQSKREHYVRAEHSSLNYELKSKSQKQCWKSRMFCVCKMLQTSAMRTLGCKLSLKSKSLLLSSTCVIYSNFEENWGKMKLNEPGRQYVKDAYMSVFWLTPVCGRENLRRLWSLSRGDLSLVLALAVHHGNRGSGTGYSETVLADAGE